MSGGTSLHSIREASVFTSSSEKLQGKAGVVAEGKIFELLRSYNYFCVDIANFATAILNLEAMKLRDLKKRDEAHFAKACDEFFSDPEIREALYVLQPAHGLAGFSLSPDTQMEMIVVPNPREQDAKMFARRLQFCRIMDFLVTDFFEGLHAGHSPRQCRNCGRFFHMTSARHQIYCDGVAPNDPDGRSCRTFAARSHRLEREKATDHPALAMYRTRLNTINKHLQRGKIDQEFADTARRIAEKCKTKACSSVQYFNDRYAADISQAGIYGATEKMRKQLEEWSVLESVRVKRIKKTAKLWQFEYRPMDADEPGMIEFTVKDNKPVNHRIVKPAENDAADLHYGREAAHLICRLAEKDALPKNEVLVLPDGDLMPRSYK